MEEESEMFGILLAWENGNGYFVYHGDWKVTSHAMRCDLERINLIVSLTEQTLLEVIAQ